MEIQRERYLQALIDRMHNGLIKVITGVRRSGKSYLVFHLFYVYLRRQGVPDDHIIRVELDLRQNRRYRDPDALLEHVETQITDDGDYYVFLDEVQMLQDFEEVLNSLLHIRNVDVYVTGSNSRFLSKDIITEFRGRGDEVHVYPLSFSEFMSAYQGDVYHGWSEYVLYGGLPLTATMRSEEQKISYLTNLFSEVYLKDIIERNHISKTQELEDLINILASAVGSLTNPSKLEVTFRSEEHSSLSRETIRQYIEYLVDAFMISPAQRYDVKGRKYIGTPIKYYFEDVGLRNARLGFRQTEENHLMENVIYNELRYRGFLVDVGVVDTRTRDADGKQQRKQLEIDFVCNKGSKRYYIQSALTMADEDKKAQEQRPLLNTGDYFKKVIITKDALAPLYDEEGVLVMGLFDFLLDPNSLDR